MKYNQDLEEVAKIEDEIKVLFKKLKRKKGNALDQSFQREHERAFEKIDCLECANCCKTTSPIFRVASNWGKSF
ncbi:MAG: hypothetical protein MK066_09090 [Crocinitomicaceae bacterium]|nr:hypothetical protein [Crocinitomicaceae bacterium]